MRTDGIPAVQTNTRIAELVSCYCGGPQQFSNSCSESRDSAQIRADLAEDGHLFADAGQRWPKFCKVQPSFPDLGNILADAAPIWANLVRLRPNLADLGQSLVNVDQFWPTSTRSGRGLPTLGAECGRSRPHSFQSRPSLGQFAPDSGPELTKHGPSATGLSSNSTDFDQLLPHEIGPKSVNFDLPWPGIGQIWPAASKFGPTSAEFDQHRQVTGPIWTELDRVVSDFGRPPRRAENDNHSGTMIERCSRGDATHSV